ncbi:MAG: YdbH domain-containing protein [Victivallaceae bacterium]
MKFATVIRSRWRVLLPVALAVLFMIAAIGWLLLPFYLERRLLPGLARPFLDLRLEARRTGLFGADFADVRGGGTDAPLSIDSIRVDYRVGYPFKVKKIILSGLRLTIDQADGEWRIGGMPLSRLRSTAAPGKAAASPLPASLRLETITVRDALLRFDYAGKRLELPCSGELRFDSEAIRFDFEGSLGKSPLKLAGTIKPAAGTVEFALHSPSLATGDLTLFKLPAAKVGFELRGRIANGTIEADCLGAITPELAGLSFEKPLETSQHLQYRAGKLLITGRTKPFHFLYAGTKRAEISDETLNTVEFETGKAPVFTLKPATLRSEIGNLRLRVADTSIQYSAGRLRFETALGARFEHLSLRLPKVTGDFPLNAPAIDFGTIQLNDKDVATGTIRGGLKDQVYFFESQITSAVYPKLRIRSTGSMPSGEIRQSEMTISLPPWRPPEAIRLRQLSDKAPDLIVNGTVSAGITMRFERGIPVFAGSVGVSDGEAVSPKGNFKVSGLSLGCQMLDLIAFRTAPGQRLSIKNIEFGRFRLNDAELRFQADSLKDYLLESSQIDWCGGTVQSRALRIYPGQRTLRTIIYCDNINLAEALKQLGVVEAEGDGVMAGQIPLRINAEGFTFEEGYLHSDPGRGGVIRIGGKGGEMLSAMTQSVDEARLLQEALKNFRYQWAKLFVSTDSENLKLNLQFDGKPDGPLPFVQDQETGRLTYRAEGKASFQGLQLNLNLSLPLNRLLKVNQLFQ